MDTVYRVIKGRGDAQDKKEIKTAIAFCATSFGSALLNSIFNLYYVHLYLNIYHLDSKWFYTGHLLFSLWNALNDPLFAYFGDFSASNQSAISRRLQAIRYGGPIWGLAFLLPWFEWFPSDNSVFLGLQFVISLFFFDALLTWVLLNHSALLADITSNNHLRTLCTMFSAMASIMGSVSVFLSYLFFEQENLTKFRIFCVVIAITASCGFTYTARNIPSVSMDSERDDEDMPPPDSPKKSLSVKSFLRQLMRHTNFWCFVGTNFLQVLLVTFFANFFTIFLDYFSEASPSFVMSSSFFRSILVACSVLFPSIATILMAPLVDKFGYYQVIKFTFVFKVLASLGMYIVNVGGPPYSAFFVSLYMIFTTMTNVSAYQFFSIVISDLAEEDFVRNMDDRTSLLSGMFFGASALVTKPGQSVAPTLGWFILSQLGYDAKSKMFISNLGSENGMLIVLITVPLVCGALQLFLWSKYSLHSENLRHLKAVYQTHKRE